jgi:hypothetical protein
MVTDFPPSTPVFPCQYHSNNTPHQSSRIVALTRRTNGQSLGGFQKAINVLSVTAKHSTANYTQFFRLFKG